MTKDRLRREGGRGSETGSGTLSRQLCLSVIITEPDTVDSENTGYKRSDT